MSLFREKQNSPRKHFLGKAFPLLLGVLGGILTARYIDTLTLSGTVSSFGLFVVLLFGMSAAYYFHIFIHEAGHLLFGLLTGYKFVSFRILSFMLSKENGKIRIRRYSLAGTGGQCLMAPPDMNDGRIPFVLYNLGGSIANAIVGGLFLIVYFLCANTSSVFLTLLLLLFAITGFLIAAMNGIPMRYRLADNDGYNSVSMSKSDDALHAFWIQMKVAELRARGLCLLDMPAEWFTIPTDEAMKNGMVATRCVLACNRLMDAEKFQEADALMSHLIEIDSGMIGLHRGLLICDRIYVELIGENRRDVIDEMLTEKQINFMKSMKRFSSVLRTEYAIALRFKRDRAEAELIKDQFEKLAKTHPDPNEIAAERTLMQIAEQKAESESPFLFSSQPWRRESF